MTLSRLKISVGSSFVATDESREKMPRKQSGNGQVYTKSHQRAESCSRVFVVDLTRTSETRLPSRAPSNDGLSYSDIESRDPADDECDLYPRSFTGCASPESSITMGPIRSAENTEIVIVPTMRSIESHCGESEGSGSQTVSSYVSQNSQRSTPEGLIIYFAMTSVSGSADDDVR